MDYTYFESEESPKIGDIVDTGRFGRCEVIDLKDDAIIVQNILTKEIFYELVGDCSLFKQAEIKPKHWISVAEWSKGGPITEAKHFTEEEAKDTVKILLEGEQVFAAYYKPAQEESK